MDIVNEIETVLTLIALFSFNNNPKECGRVAKPSTELQIEDIIEINYFKKKMVVKVLSFQQTVKKDDASDMYEVISVVEN